MPLMIEGKKYVSIKEAAEIIGVTEGRVRQFISRDQLPSIQIGKRLRMLPLEDVKSFAESDRPSGIHRDKQN